MEFAWSLAFVAVWAILWRILNELKTISSQLSGVLVWQEGGSEQPMRLDIICRQLVAMRNELEEIRRSAVAIDRLEDDLRTIRRAAESIKVR
jgi:hypothetical protein